LMNIESYIPTEGTWEKKGPMGSSFFDFLLILDDLSLWPSETEH
jgi:hypothetical protein